MESRISVEGSGVGAKKPNDAFGMGLPGSGEERSVTKPFPTRSKLRQLGGSGLPGETAQLTLPKKTWPVAVKGVGSPLMRGGEGIVNCKEPQFTVPCGMHGEKPSRVACGFGKRNVGNPLKPIEKKSLRDSRCRNWFLGH